MPKRHLSLILLAGVGACGGGALASGAQVTTAVAPVDVVLCVRKTLEANGYKTGRVDAGDGFIEAAKMVNVAGQEADLQLVRRGNLITVKAVPAASGGTAVNLTVVGQADRRTQRGPTVTQERPNAEGIADAQKVRAACFPDQSAG